MKAFSSKLLLAAILINVIALGAWRGEIRDKIIDKHKHESEAAPASLTWLKLVDDMKYAQSWSEAAELFKSSIRQEQWVEALSSSRKTFGRLVERTISSKEFRTSLPGALDGYYVIIICNTSFEKKKEAVETITMMKEKDGTWRVAGYYIK